MDMFRSFEEKFGVSDFLCAPGMMAKVDPAAAPEVQLRARVEASARFAEEIVSRAG